MTERLTILRAATHETQLGDHDVCLSRSNVMNITIEADFHTLKSSTIKDELFGLICLMILNI